MQTIPIQNFRGTGSQNIAFETAGDEGLVFASDDGKAKQYHVCSGFEALYEFIFAQTPERRTYYEMIPPGTPVKLYFDLDLKGDSNVVRKMDAIQAALVGLVNMKLMSLFDRIVGPDDIVVLRSDGHIKASRHLIWPLYFEDVAHVKAFVHEHVVPSMPDAVDKSVYTKNRCFRLFGCHKVGSDRTLKSGRSDGSEATRKRIFMESLLTYPAPNGTVLRRVESTPPPGGTKRARPHEPRTVKRQRPLAPLEGFDMQPVVDYLTPRIRENEDVASPTVSRLRDTLYHCRFIQTAHKKPCLFGAYHAHQQLAVNVDVRTGRMWYKCYGTEDHPLKDDGDVQQSMALTDLPEHLRMREVYCFNTI